MQLGEKTDRQQCKLWVSSVISALNSIKRIPIIKETPGSSNKVSEAKVVLGGLVVLVVMLMTMTTTTI